MIVVTIVASLATIAIAVFGARVYFSFRRRHGAPHHACGDARRRSLDVVADAESLMNLARLVEANPEAAPWDAINARQDSLLRSIRHLDQRASRAGFHRAAMETNKAAARFAIELRRRRELSVPNAIRVERPPSAPKLDQLSDELLIAARFLSIVAHTECCVVGYGSCTQP